MFQNTDEVSHGHVTNLSYMNEEDYVHTLFFEQARPLGSSVLKKLVLVTSSHKGVCFCR